MLAAFTSSRLVATSSLKNRSNSATVIGSFSTPIFANRSCTDGNASAFTTSSCSLSTMARGVCWQVCSGIERIDRIGLESGLDQRRHIWQRGGALRCADRERFKLAVTDGTDDGGYRRNAEVDAPRDRVSQPLGTLERNMLRHDSGTDGEPNGSEVRRGPDADGRIVQLAGLGLRSGNQLAQRVITPFRRHHDQRGLAKRNHPREIGNRVVRQS